MLENYVKKILGSRVYDLAVESPLSPAPLLSRRLGLQVSLKREDMQSVYSFKLRGAYNKMAQLSEAQKSTGVITASAGNHAQAVAYHAEHMGIPATIVMPAQTPFAKVARTRAFGAKVVLEGRNLNECEGTVNALIQEHGLTLIHPYDNEWWHFTLVDEPFPNTYFNFDVE